MPTYLQSNLSAYLVRPRVSAQHQSRRLIVQLRWFIGTLRTQPLHTLRGAAGLCLWALLAAGWHYATTTHILPGQAAMPGSHALAAAEPQTTALSTATHAQALPGGPTGQLLPPGTMAADGAYRNSYARGQCTWYVAGRRQIPPNWGNATQWFYHATASGWHVGTVPAIAAIAWSGAGYYGHVALVEQISSDGQQIFISEMNYRGVGIKSTRWVAAKQFKYIY